MLATSTDDPPSYNPSPQPQHSHPLTFARSSAHEALNITEIRREIFGYLDKADLATFMRVRRDCQDDVARKLYRSMKFAPLQSRLSANAYRQALYIGSVVEVYATWKDLPAESWESSKANRPPLIARYLAGDSPHLRIYPGRYSKDICSLITELVKEACPKVRKIHYEKSGCYVPFGPAAWTIHCDWAVPSIPSDVNHDFLAPPMYADRIELFHTYECQLHEAPHPNSLNPPPSPEGTTLRQRFDFRLSSLDIDYLHQQGYHDAWLPHLRTKPCWADIWRSCDFSDLPVSLDDLASLYRKQIESGHSDRLQHVTAFKAVPWSITEFGDFSRLAGSSLTSLVLTNGGPSDQTLISFSDLASLMTRVKEDLPNLKVLWLAMKGVEESEEVCQSLLSSETLEQYGSVTNLCIVTKPTKIIPFNVLRAVAPICASGVSVTVCGAGVHEKVSGSDKDSQYLRYLRSQNDQRRRNLSVADFDSMLLGKLEDVQRLDYNQDVPQISPRIFRDRVRAKVEECVRLLDAGRFSDASISHVFDISQKATGMVGTAKKAAEGGPGGHVAKLEKQAQDVIDLMRSTRNSVGVILQKGRLEKMWRILPIEAERIMLGIVEACKVLRATVNK